jgi:HK97 family phage prohead protease
MPDNEMLIKQYIAKSDVDDEERTVTAVVSTDVVDREGEVLLPKGVDFEQYLKNPVVLWAHDYRETPIARSLWMTKGRKGITAKAKFADTEKAEEIYQLFKGGYLNAFSVGFLPKKYHEPTPDEVKKRPEWAEASLIYDEWELLEFSAVPVPANPEALATAVKSKTLSISKELQNELGIEEDEETTHLAWDNTITTTDSTTTTTNIDCDFASNGNAVEPEKIVIVVEVEPIKVEAASYFAEPLVNWTAVINTAIKRAKGIMY